METEAAESTDVQVPKKNTDLLSKGFVAGLIFNQLDKLFDIAVGVEWFQQKQHANWFSHVMFFVVFMANCAEFYTFKTDSVLSKNSTTTAVLALLGFGPLAYILQVRCMKYQNLEEWRLQEALYDMKFSYFLLEVCPSITVQFFVIKHHSEEITPLLIVGAVWSTAQVFVCTYMTWSSLRSIAPQEAEGAIAFAFLFMVPSVSITLGLCYAGKHYSFHEDPHLVYLVFVGFVMVFGLLFFFQTAFEKGFEKLLLAIKQCFKNVYDFVTCVPLWNYLEAIEARQEFS